MNHFQLKQFMIVADEGSVTRGAERAAISQPALSRAIADLERSVGDRLFDRVSRGVVLTAAGQVLYQYAQKIFGMEVEVMEALQDLRQLNDGRLRIGASTTVGDYLLPKVLTAFVRQYPRVQISMEVSNTGVIQAGVHSGRYDIGFTEGKVSAEGFHVQVVFEDRLVVIAAPTHGLSKRRIVKASDLDGERFIMREMGSGTREVVEARFEQVGIRPEVVYELGSTAAIKYAVSEGLGMAVVSRAAILSELNRGELRALQTNLDLKREIHSVRLGWRSESAAVRRFQEVLRSILTLGEYEG